MANWADTINARVAEREARQQTMAANYAQQLQRAQVLQAARNAQQAAAPPASTDPNALPEFSIPEPAVRFPIKYPKNATPAVIQAMQTKRAAQMEKNDAVRRNRAYLEHMLNLNKYQMGQADKYGDSFREQLARNRVVQLAGDRESYRRRGLTNTTLNNQRGVEADYNFQRRSLEDDLLAKRQALVGQRGAIIAGINDPVLPFQYLQQTAAAPTNAALAEQQAAQMREDAQRQQLFDLGGLIAGAAAQGATAYATGGLSSALKAGQRQQRQSPYASEYIPSGLNYQEFDPYGNQR